MKKKIALLLVSLMASNLIGCGSTATNTTSAAASEVSSSESKTVTTESAASTSESASTDTGEKVTVKLSVWGSGAAENFQKGADEFNSRQNKINFVVEMQTGDYSQYLGAKVASNDLPDMFFLGPYAQVQEFAENDRILDLSDQPFVSKIYDSAKKSVTYNGKIYAYPMCNEMLGIYYNKDLFEKVGITTIPTTIDELQKDCEILQKNNITPFAAIYKDSWTLNHLWSCLQGATVGDADSWVSDMNAGKGTFKTDNFGEIFDFCDLLKANSGNNYMDADSTAGFNAFASGDAAMLVSGEFSLLNAASINPNLNVGLFAVPATNNSSDAKLDVDVGITIGINKNTQNLDADLQVLNYLSDNTDKNGWMHYTADALGSAPPTMDYTVSSNKYPYYQDYLNYMKNGQNRIWIYQQLASGANNLIGSDMQGYFAGTTDRDATLKKMDSDFADLLAQ